MVYHSYQRISLLPTKKTLSKHGGLCIISDWHLVLSLNCLLSPFKSSEFFFFRVFSNLLHGEGGGGGGGGGSSPISIIRSAFLLIYFPRRYCNSEQFLATTKLLTINLFFCNERGDWSSPKWLKWWKYKWNKFACVPVVGYHHLKEAHKLTLVTVEFFKIFPKNPVPEQLGL